MPNYDYICDKCGSTTQEFFRIADKVDSITCACGGTAQYRISPPTVMNHSYADGVKRKGWAEMREAAKLKKDIAGTDDQSKKQEMRKEITKMGVKIGEA